MHPIPSHTNRATTRTTTVRSILIRPHADVDLMATHTARRSPRGHGGCSGPQRGFPGYPPLSAGLLLRRAANGLAGAPRPLRCTGRCVSVLREAVGNPRQPRDPWDRGRVGHPRCRSGIWQRQQNGLNCTTLPLCTAGRLVCATAALGGDGGGGISAAMGAGRSRRRGWAGSSQRRWGRDDLGGGGGGAISAARVGGELSVAVGAGRSRRRWGGALSADVGTGRSRPRGWVGRS